MTCGKVVYPISGNEFISGYCGLTTGHEGQCKIVPEEFIVQICKQVLLERGEVIVPLRSRQRSYRVVGE